MKRSSCRTLGGVLWVEGGWRLRRTQACVRRVEWAFAQGRGQYRKLSCTKRVASWLIHPSSCK